MDLWLKKPPLGEPATPNRSRSETGGSSLVMSGSAAGATRHGSPRSSSHIVSSGTSVEPVRVGVDRLVPGAALNATSRASIDPALKSGSVLNAPPGGVADRQFTGDDVQRYAGEEPGDGWCGQQPGEPTGVLPDPPAVPTAGASAPRVGGRPSTPRDQSQVNEAAGTAHRMPAARSARVRYGRRDQNPSNRMNSRAEARSVSRWFSGASGSA